MTYQRRIHRLEPQADENAADGDTAATARRLRKVWRPLLGVERRRLTDLRCRGQISHDPATVERQARLSESVRMPARQSGVSSSCQPLREDPELADAIPGALTGRKSRPTLRGGRARPLRRAGRRCLDGPRDRQRPGPGGTARARRAAADAVAGRRPGRAPRACFPLGREAASAVALLALVRGGEPWPSGGSRRGLGAPRSA